MVGKIECEGQVIFYNFNINFFSRLKQSFYKE